MNEHEVYPIGSRIVIRGNWEWPDGTTGTVAEFPEAIRSLHYQGADQPDYAWLYYIDDTLKGPKHMQWVEFDQLTDDGSGDGPYGAGVVDVENLWPKT